MPGQDCDGQRSPYVGWPLVSTIRSFSVIPMNKTRLSGLLHSLSRDDVYRGFFIPKGLIPLSGAFCY
jgi:hypothetical protein